MCFCMDFFWFILFGMLYFLDLDVYFFLKLKEVFIYYFFKQVYLLFFLSPLLKGLIMQMLSSDLLNYPHILNLFLCTD